MRKFEYTIREAKSDETNNGSLDKRKFVSYALNEMGSKGWELVQVTQPNLGWPIFKLWFKREIIKQERKTNGNTNN